MGLGRQLCELLSTATDRQHQADTAWIHPRYKTMFHAEAKLRIQYN